MKRRRKHIFTSSQLLTMGRWLFYTAGVFFVLAFIFLVLINSNFTDKIHLQLGSTMKMETLSSAITQSENELKNKNDEIKQKIDELSEINESSNKLIEESTKINNDISQLQNVVAEQKDSFVTVTTYAANSSGNGYAPGNCTYYVKEMRPDLPNDLGNANQWYVNAKAEGFKVGSKPKIGAVGVSYEGWAGHVVYVQKIKKNGNIIISEMNYMGLWNKNTREVSPSSFVYIYSL